MSTLRTANKIRMPRRSSVETLSECLGSLSSQMLRTIAEVNDALGVIERPTNVEAARTLVATVLRDGRVTPYQPSHHALVFNCPERASAPHPFKSRIPICPWWQPQLELDI